MDFFSWLLQNSLKPMFWFQPLFYTLHGWLATEMALWMLFHPYEPKFLPGTKFQLPFTPGIFPRGRHKLSRAIAHTITEILLTQEDIKKQAEKLITQDNIYRALDALMDSIGQELRDISHIRRIHRHVDKFVPPLLEKLLRDSIANLEAGDEKHFQAIVEPLFNRVIPYLTISEAQAGLVAKSICHTIVTPANVRQILIDILIPENIALLDSAIRQRVTGFQGLVLRFVDISKSFSEFRLFLIDEVEEAETVIAQALEHLAVEQKVQQQVLKFSPQQLPVETLEEVKLTVIDSLRKALITHQEAIIQVASQLSEEATQAITRSLVHVDYKTLAKTWLPGFKRDLARFIYTYLNKELEHLLSMALPAISLNTVIVAKIDQFSAQQLEETIQRICHRELRWLAFLGAFLGFWLGLVSNMVSYWWHPVGR